MLGVDEAREEMFRRIKPLPIVEVPLAQALYRTLAAPVVCDVDYPPFDRAVMDGYAVRADDVAKAPVTLKVVEEIAAGARPGRALGAGEAARINTGAPIPSGADAVVRVEVTELSASGDAVLIGEPVRVGKFVTPRASYVSAGDTVIAPKTLLTPINLGAAATAGAARVRVYRRPQVAVLATGNELVDIDNVPTGSHIRNSNQYLLEALIRDAHAEAVVLGVARDDRDELRALIKNGLQSDVLCLTGGVSKGSFDFVPEVLAACGVTIHVHRIAIKPGRPTLFGTMPDHTLVFGLPGNPMSAFVGFELLVRPGLAALQGREGYVPSLIGARLRGEAPAPGDRTSYAPARAQVAQDGGWQVELLSWHGSGDSLGAATANALVVRPAGADAAADGEIVSIILMDRE